jgi:hypothetical protein
MRGHHAIGVTTKARTPFDGAPPTNICLEAFMRILLMRDLLLCPEHARAWKDLIINEPPPPGALN